MRRQASRPSAKVGEPVGRRGLGGGCRVQPQPGAGDDAERALGADEELGEVRARPPGGRCRRCVMRRAVGQDDVEADDHVLDLAVAGRELAGAAAGQPPADRRQRDRLGPVADGEAVLACAARPRGGRRRCRQRRRRTSDVSSTSRMPISPHRSSTTPPRTGTEPPTTPLRPAAGGDRDAGLVADAPGPPRPRRRRTVGRTGGGQAGDLVRRAPRSWRAATSRGWPRPGRRRRSLTSAHAGAGGRAARRGPRRGGRRDGPSSPRRVRPARWRRRGAGPDRIRRRGGGQERCAASDVVPGRLGGERARQAPSGGSSVDLGQVGGPVALLVDRRR